LIKDDILTPLDFSDTDYCIDCIKGKYAKQVSNHTHEHLWSIPCKICG
jgi:hypothetical protein